MYFLRLGGSRKKTSKNLELNLHLNLPMSPLSPFDTTANSQAFSGAQCDETSCESLKLLILFG